MSDFTSRLPARASLEQLKKQAKDLLRSFRAGDSVAEARFGAASAKLIGATRSRPIVLADAQFVVAREHGFESWGKLKQHIATLDSASRAAQFERLATAFVAAYSGDAEALAHLNEFLPRLVSQEA